MMRQVATYTQEEMEDKPQERMFLDTAMGTYILENGMFLTRPGIRDYLFTSEGRRHLLGKLRNVGKAIKQKEYVRVESEPCDWRSGTGNSNWRK